MLLLFISNYFFTVGSELFCIGHKPSSCRFQIVIVSYFIWHILRAQWSSAHPLRMLEGIAENKTTQRKKWPGKAAEQWKKPYSYLG